MLTASAQSTPTVTTLSPCPNGNSTLYKTDGKMFLQTCGRDYSGVGEAVDLGVAQSSSMEDCIGTCADTPGCTGCGWGYIPGDTADSHRCWLKRELMASHSVRANWTFAILQ